MAKKVPSSPEPVHSSGPLGFLHPTTRYHPLVPQSQQAQEQVPQQQQQQEAVGQQRPHGHSGITTAPPTTTSGQYPTQTQAQAPGQPQHQHTIYHVWRSRDNRKGRHRAVVYLPPPGSGPESSGGSAGAADVKVKDGGVDMSARKGRGQQGKWRLRWSLWLRSTGDGLVRMVTRFPVWDVSWLVAVVFVWGSIIWCINGCFIWLPLAAPWTEFPGETVNAGGILAFIGATVFEVGSALALLEAINAERSDCFGWALEESLGLESWEEDSKLRLRPQREACHHHHRRRGVLAKGGAKQKTDVEAKQGADGIQPGGLKESSSDNDENTNIQKVKKQRQWQWYPTLHDLKTHYLKEIGFLASLIQMVAATIFWIAGITSLPPIYEALSPGAMTGVYWVPQVVGGSGFVISGFMLMVEVQETWYKPRLNTLGWHVGFWNFIGGFGFTVCPAVGFGSESSSALEYASALSTFIGSWAFLIGSLAQWYESLDKYPISVKDDPSWSPSGEKAV